MKSNLCVVGFAPEFTISISKMLAYRLSMFYASINEMLEFDIINIEEAKEVVGIDYIEKLENEKIETLFSFENAVITMDIGMFIRGDNVKKIKKSAYVIFLDIPRELLTKLYGKNEKRPEDLKEQLRIYDERTNYCKKKCDFYINLNCLNKRIIVAEILNKLKNHEYN